MVVRPSRPRELDAPAPLPLCDTIRCDTCPRGHSSGDTNELYIRATKWYGLMVMRSRCAYWFPPKLANPFHVLVKRWRTRSRWRRALLGQARRERTYLTSIQCGHHRARHDREWKRAESLIHCSTACIGILWRYLDCISRPSNQVRHSRLPPPTLVQPRTIHIPPTSSNKPRTSDTPPSHPRAPRQAPTDKLDRGKADTRRRGRSEWQTAFLRG